MVVVPWYPDPTRGLAPPWRGAARSGRKTFAELQPEEVAAPEAKPEWGTALGTVMFIKADQTLYYTACPSADCKKKVTQEGSDWRCEACAASFPECKRRYIISFKAADAAAPCWLARARAPRSPPLRIPPQLPATRACDGG